MDHITYYGCVEMDVHANPVRAALCAYYVDVMMCLPLCVQRAQVDLVTFAYSSKPLVCDASSEFYQVRSLVFVACRLHREIFGLWQTR